MKITTEKETHDKSTLFIQTGMKRQARVGDLSSTEGLTPGLNVSSMRGSPAGKWAGARVAGMKVANYRPNRDEGAHRPIR